MRNPERFRDSPSGTLVRGTVGQAAYLAYVPYPLPPPLNLSVPLANALSRADRAVGQLAGLGEAAPNPVLLRLFAGPIVRREAVASSRIERIETTVRDLYDYEIGQLHLFHEPPAVPDPAVREVYNYVCALEYGLDALGRLPVCLRLIREMHTVLMKGVRGDSAAPGEFYRRGPLSVRGDSPLPRRKRPRRAPACVPPPFQLGDAPGAVAPSQ